jgi:hypothetical protein
MRDLDLQRSFLRHRGLIAFAAGGAAVETALLLIMAPAAVALAPQATAMPSIAAYHDLRWLFAGQQSALTFALGGMVLLVVRAAVDTAMLRLAWPSLTDAAAAGPGLAAGAGLGGGPGTARGLAVDPGFAAVPPMMSAFWSCAGLTALTWLLLTPAVTLTFGVAVLPFSWPFLAALPLVIGITAALSHGGVTASWWRRLPPPATVGWLLISFLVLSVASIAMLRSAAVVAVFVAAVAGLVNARAWYGIAATAAHLPHEVTTHDSAWRSVGRMLSWIPAAPIAALLVVVLAVGVVRLMFTGTIQFPQPSSVSAASLAAGAGPAHPPAARHVSTGAVLVVDGFGSYCCNDTGDLASTGLTVRQFSYAGLNKAGRPIPQGSSADDVPLPELGDRMAKQVLRLHDMTRQPVDIVAESEGTLGLYAMLARHPGLPIRSMVLLSPIIAPGQYGTDDTDAIPRDALNELNVLIGRMSPYGSSGAGELIGSVARYGAQYFADVSRYRTNSYLAVVPLADATTMPACSLPSNILVVPQWHGGLLGDPQVQASVGDFLTGRDIPEDVVRESAGLREAADAISQAAAAWRMPASRLDCR